MRIFDRPDLDQRRGRLALFVTGAFAVAKPSLVYESRLQIHNQVGGATVEQIDGDQLPPGHALYVDGDEVVIAWPAYQETGVIPFAGGNGNFEKGDTGWSKGAGWFIEAAGGDNDGFGAYVGVYRGQGDSFMEAEAYSPTFPGQTFSAQLNVQQGASSKYNVGAAIAMRYYDGAKNLIADQMGPFIDDGSKGAWHLSQGTFITPAGASFVRGAARGGRFRENKPLWVDDASWTLQATVGINHEKTLALTLRVRDSAGRSYLWRGQVIVADRPVAYRAFANFGTPLIGAMSYRHLDNVVQLLGGSNVSGVGNTYRIAASDDASMACVGYTAPPSFKAYPVSPAGVFGTAFADPSPALPGAGRSAAFARSGAALVIGHEVTPFVRAHRISPAGLGAIYDPPASLPPGRIVEVAFSPSGSIVYMCSDVFPYFAAYRWTDANGFGARLSGPAAVPGSGVSSISINESGTHLAALCAADPSCHIYKIGADGFEGRIATVGSNGSGQVSLSDAAGAVAFGRGFLSSMQAFRWSPVTGVGTEYTQPAGLIGNVTGIAFSRDGKVLYTGVTSNSGLMTYEWSAGVGATRGPTAFGTTACNYVVAID